MAEGTGGRHHHLLSACQCLACILETLCYVLPTSGLRAGWSLLISSDEEMEAEGWGVVCVGGVDQLPKVILYKLSNCESRIHFLKHVTSPDFDFIRYHVLILLSS